MININKWLQAHPKFQNSAWWTSLIAGLAMVVNQIANLLGYQIVEVVGQVEQVLVTVITILAATGVFLYPPKLSTRNQNDQLDQ